MSTSFKWHRVDDVLPECKELVWLYDAKSNEICLGCRIKPDNDGWLWAIHDGTALFVEDAKIAACCDFEDLTPTHWQYLPNVPKI
jgi:hypothetical protein